MPTNSDSDINPKAKEIAGAAISHAKAMASGNSGKSTTDSPGAIGSSKDQEKMGGTGSSGGGSSGGGHGGGNNPFSSEGKLPEEEKERLLKFLLIAFIVVGVVGLLIPLSAMYTAIKSTTPEGIEQTSQILAHMEEEEKREHEETMAEKKLKEARIRERNGLTPFPDEQSSPKLDTPARNASNCKVVGDKEGATRLTAIQPSFGQCFTLPGSSIRQLFFLMLNSPPKEITGQASFAHMREEREEDKAGRRARCMAQTGDAEYCEVEMQKRVGVRVDYCLTMDSPDRCISYLKGKTHVPIVVHSDEPVSINMQ